MAYETTIEASARTGISLTTIYTYCRRGKIDGAQKVGRDWIIPVVWNPDETPLVWEDHPSVKGIYVTLAKAAKYAGMGRASLYYRASTGDLEIHEIEVYGVKHKMVKVKDLDTLQRKRRKKGEMPEREE